MSLLTLPNELHFNMVHSFTQLSDVYHLALSCRRSANLFLPIIHAEAKSDVDGYTALEWACRSGHESLLRFLLREGAHVNSYTGGSQPVIYHAIAGKKPRVIVPILLEHGADITIPYPGRRVTALHEAVSVGDESIVKLLLDRGLLDVNLRVMDGRPPLHTCCASTNPSPEIAKLLLSHGANPEAPIRTAGGVWPLHVITANTAASAPEVLRVLLAHGANIGAVDWRRRVPLHYAAELDGEEMLEILLDHGASVSAVDDHGRTPLHLAAKKGVSPEVCEMLLRHGADIAARDNDGHTPLDSAAIGAGASVPLEVYFEPGYEATIRVLLSRGAAKYSSEELGGQLLLWAVKNGHHDLLRMVLEQSVDVNVRDAEGRTPLHWAALFGMVDTVKLLLDRGADACAMAEGKTALTLAAARGEDGVVEVLVGAGGSVLGSGEGDRRRKPPPAHGSRRGMVVMD